MRSACCIALLPGRPVEQAAQPGDYRFFSLRLQACYPLKMEITRPLKFAATLPQRRFQLVLIKPSHYDDDGYVIRWWRAMIPSNSLAAIYGIAADCAERQVLGPDIAVAIEVIDETNTRVNVPQLLERFRS